MSLSRKSNCLSILSPGWNLDRNRLGLHVGLGSPAFGALGPRSKPLLLTMRTPLSHLVPHSMNDHILENDSLPSAVMTLLQSSIERPSCLAVSAAAFSRKSNIFLDAKKGLLETYLQIDSLIGGLSIPLPNLVVLFSNLVVPDLLLTVQVIDGPHGSITQHLIGPVQLRQLVAALPSSPHSLVLPFKPSPDLLFAGRKVDLKQVI